MLHLDRELIKLQSSSTSKGPIAFVVFGGSRCQIVELDEGGVEVRRVLATGATPNEVVGIARRQVTGAS
jgi:hypothetical protein